MSSKKEKETFRVDADESLVNLFKGFANFILYSNGCKICGCFVTNWTTHKAFHESKASKTKEGNDE